MTSRSIVHVIPDPGSAALLNLAGLGIPICLRDDLSCGPVLDFAVTVPGWSGAGYIILDQDTGAGAFKIAGGQNGGFLKWVDDHAIPLLLLGIVLGAFDTPLIFAIRVILAAVTAIAAIYVFYEESLDNQCFPLFWLFAGIGVGFALFALVAGAGFGFVVALALYGFIASEAVKAASNSSICKNSPPPPADEGF